MRHDGFSFVENVRYVRMDRNDNDRDTKVFDALEQTPHPKSPGIRGAGPRCVGSMNHGWRLDVYATGKSI